MLKITMSENDDGQFVMRLEGKLLEPWVAEFVPLCCASETGSLPRLDLSNLTFVDEAGLAILREFLVNGGQLERCSPFVAELLKH